MSSEANAAATPATGRLAGERICFVGPLASMSRTAAERLVAREAGTVAPTIADGPTLVVIGDETSDWRVHAGPLPADHAQRRDAFEVVHESALWLRLGLVDSEDDAQAATQRLYTPAMLAELLRVPVAAIRRWLRRGYLRPKREVGRLAYLAMQEVHAARTLAALVAEGCSLARVDKLVAQLADAAPDVDRPLIDLAVVVGDGRLYFRRGDDLSEPGGQLLLDFEPAGAGDPPPAAAIALGHSQSLADADLAPPASGAPGDEGAAGPPPAFEHPDQAREAALDLESEGDTAGAIEACRGVLLSGQGRAEDHFLLAELLYRRGEPAAARERYYATLEMDEDFVEARTSLGCLLAELGDTELAIAALRGAAEQQPGFADAPYHAARGCDEAGRREEAER
ncbi:MAG: MerR family transcriptional regulator, partial [Planctomycetota bacterium]